MKNVSKETLIRTGILFVTLINSVLSMLGKNPLPFSDSEIYQAISAVCTVAATVWAWWKNNSFTNAAIKADEYKNALELKEKKEKVDSNEENQSNKEDELK